MPGALLPREDTGRPAPDRDRWALQVMTREAVLLMVCHSRRRRTGARV